MILVLQKIKTRSEEDVRVMNAAEDLRHTKSRDDSAHCYKKDNNREQYERSKIEQGVLSACYKRPVPAEAIQKTIDAVELEIFNREEKEIPSSEIGEIVMEKLKELDPVAYVRFASVYREFKDAGTFMDELKKFLQ